MKKIYIFAAVLALLTLSLNAQINADTKAKDNTKDHPMCKKAVAKIPTMNQMLAGIKGMSSILPEINPNGNFSSGPMRAPLKINSDEYTVGPFDGDNFDDDGGLGFGALYPNNQNVRVATILNRSEFVDHAGDQIVGFRFALAGQTTTNNQVKVYDFISWPVGTNGYFESSNSQTWNLGDFGNEVSTEYQLINDDLTSTNFSTGSITTSAPWTATSVSNQTNGSFYILSGGNLKFTVPSGYSNSDFKFTLSTRSSYYSGTFTFTPSSGSAVTLTTSAANTVYECELTGLSTGDVVTITGRYGSSAYSPDFTYMHVYAKGGTANYLTLTGGQWHEYYLDEPIDFVVNDSIDELWLGYSYEQYPSSSTNELCYPMGINPVSTTHDHAAWLYYPSSTVSDLVITVPSNTMNIRSITVYGSDNSVLTSLNINDAVSNSEYTQVTIDGDTYYAVNLPTGWSVDYDYLLLYGNSSDGYYGYVQGAGDITISNSVLGGNSTVSVVISAYDDNGNVTMSVNNNGKTIGNSLSSYTWSNISLGNTTYDYGLYSFDFSQYGDLAVQLIFKSSLNPTIEITPATQTISDAAAATLTVTGTDIDGNINVSAANNDWTVNPTSLANTGGNVSVTYTGRDLSATTTVTATAANDNTVTASATVNYVADLYIVGNFGSGWDFTNGTSMTYNNGTYTATLTVDAGNYILFARLLGNSNPWNTRDVFGPSSNGDWWMQGNSANGTIDLNDDDPIYFPEGGTYRITIDANNGTFTITKLSGEQTAQPVITYSSDGEHVTITATGDGTVTLNVPGYDPVSGEGEVSITVPCGYVSNTITVSATAQESGKDESDPTYRDITIPAGSDWVEMDGTYDDPNDLLSFLKDGEDIMMVDQFAASTLKNEHPDHYTYTLRQTVNGETTTSTPVSIPVYKTNSSMQGLYTKNQVDVVDKNMSLRPNVVNTEMDFDVNPDRNVLYYSLYRGDLNATYPEITAQSRVSQLQKFEEMVGEGENAQPQYFLFESHQTGIAPRYDRLGTAIAERLDTNWVEAGYDDQLAYVPVIWTYGLYTARGDGKNNSYGSDIKREYMGKVDATITGTYTAGNDYGTWKVGETEYCVFHPTITVTGVLPQNDNNNVVLYNDEDEATYVPYMCRAWCTYEGIHDFIRNSDGNLQDAGALPTPYWLGDAIFDGSNTATIGGEWTGGSVRDQWSFGLPSGTSPDEVTYIIRFYYKKVVTEGQQNGSKGKLIGGATEEYFMAETGGEFGEWVVGINELYNGIVPVDVTYVNPQGMKSSRPFDGVNIVVTRYSDGSTRTSKIIR